MYAIGVDIGGSSICCGLVDRRGRIKKGSYRRCSVHSRGSAEEILATFSQTLKSCLEWARREQLPLAGMGVGMCGPLDYGRGIVLIKGVDKYEALYGVNLKDELHRRLALPASFPIHFLIDAWAFARGEIWLGEGKGFQRVVALTLGTGIGSGFVDGGCLVSKAPGVPPPFGWIGGLPFQDGILDDYISTRGVLRLYRAVCPNVERACPTVADIARRARAGDATCREVFQRFGAMLGAALIPSLSAFEAECLVLGGMISRSFSLFEDPLRESLGTLSPLQKIAATRSPGRAPVKGAAHLILHGSRQKAPQQKWPPSELTPAPK